MIALLLVASIAVPRPTLKGKAGEQATHFLARIIAEACTDREGVEPSEPLIRLTALRLARCTHVNRGRRNETHCLRVACSMLTDPWAQPK